MYRIKKTVVNMVVVLLVMFFITFAQAETKLNLLTSGKLFYDDFSTYVEGNNGSPTWQINPYVYSENVVVGTWKVEAGEYSGVDQSLWNGAITGRFNWTDIVVEAKMKILEPEAGKQPYYEGIVFRWKSAGEHYAYFIDGGNKLLRLIVVTPAGLRDITSMEINHEYNKWYNLKVKAKGSVFYCYLDNKLMFGGEDKTYPKGKIGLWAHTCAHFDEVKVYSSTEVTITDLKPGQKVELCDVKDRMVVDSTVANAKTSTSLDVSSISIPFTGYFKVYSPDGKDVFKISFKDICGGDIYQFVGAGRFL